MPLPCSPTAGTRESSSSPRTVGGSLGSLQVGRRGSSLLLARSVNSGRVAQIALAGEPVGLASGAGSEVVVAEQPPALEVVDLDGKKPSRRFPLPGAAVSLAASPNGRFLASAAADGTVTLVDSGSGAAVVLSGLGPDPAALAFSADGALLAGASAARAGIVVWSTVPGFPQTRIGASGGTVRSLAWALDGHTLYSGPSGLPVVQVWDVSDDRQIGRPIVGSDSSATTVTASAVDVTSRVLGVGTAQGLVKFLAIDTRRPTVSARPSDVNEGIVSVAFADHGAARPHRRRARRADRLGRGHGYPSWRAHRGERLRRHGPHPGERSRRSRRANGGLLL